jgi:hypothetical protein
MNNQTNEEKTLIEKIKIQYQAINRKTDFLIELSQKIGNSPRTIRNHWVSAFWSIPEQHQQLVLDEINKKIESQELIKSVSNN